MDRIARFWEELAGVYCNKPEWILPNKEIYRNHTFALLQFKEGTGTPVLIIPPNAGHHSSIAERLIETCQTTIPDAPIYSMHWIPADACNESRNDTLNDLYDFVATSVKIINKPVHLIGLCQGGWLGAIYAAMNPEKVKTLILAAAPIDFHAAKNESKIQNYLKAFPQEWYEGMVYLGGGVWPGDMQLLGFRNMNPYERYVEDYLELWQAVDSRDEKAIARWRRNHIWYDNPQNVGGAWFLEAVDKLFRKNMLVKKELKIHGEIADLSRINCPVYMLAGDADDITQQEEMFSLEKYVSSTRIEKFVIPDAGHIGVFLKKQALAYWQKIMEDVGKAEVPVPVSIKR